MDPNRFIPKLEEIEERYTPAVDLSGIPADVRTAAQIGHFFFTGTNAAIENDSFIRVVANRTPTLNAAAVIEQQAPQLANVLAQYVVTLENQRDTANPVYTDWFNQVIAQIGQYENEARASVGQAQAVANEINALNAAATSGTGTTGTTGTTGINGIGSTNGLGTMGTGTTGLGTTSLGPTTGTTTGTTGTTTGTTGTTGTTTTPTTGTTTTTTNSGSTTTDTTAPETAQNGSITGI